MHCKINMLATELWGSTRLDERLELSASLWCEQANGTPAAANKEAPPKPASADTFDSAVDGLNLGVSPCIWLLSLGMTLCWTCKCTCRSFILSSQPHLKLSVAG